MVCCGGDNSCIAHQTWIRGSVVTVLNMTHVFSTFLTASDECLVKIRV